MEETPTTPNPGSRSPRIHGRYNGSVCAFCCVPGCSNSRGRYNRKGLSFSFCKFPADKKRSELLLSRIIHDGKVVPFVPKSHSKVCSERFERGQKNDNPDKPAYVPTVFPRNSAVKQSTLRSRRAGSVTQLPSSTSKKRTSSSNVVEAGRPKRPRKLDYIKGENPKAVWETMDYDYIKTKTSSDVSDENMCDMADQISEN